jgi:ELWxxDGT repeat protein
MSYGMPQLLKDITPSTASTNIEQVYPFKNSLYFNVRNTTEGSDIWKSDGTTTGTKLVKRMGKLTPYFLSNLSNLSQPHFLIRQDDGNEFTFDNYQLWKTNGTAKGTTLVKDLGKWDNYFWGDIHKWNDKFYFKSAVYNTTTNTNNYELWQTDGTNTGTKLIKRLGINQPKSIFDNIQNNQNLYFTTVQDDGDWETPDPYQLWKTNGTTTGSTLVKNLGKWNHYYFGDNLSDWNGKVYFTSAVYNTTTKTNNYELWQTDGTTTGTKLLKRLGINKPHEIYSWIDDNQNLYFSTVQGNDSDGNSNPDNYQLWKTDGTATGTQLVKNLGKWGYYGNVDDWNGKVYFTSAVYNSITKTNNYELWQTDGTKTGTKLVKKLGINQPSEGFYNDHGVSDDQNLYFMTFQDDGNWETLDTRRLWKTDGTTTGTTLIKNLDKSNTFGNINQVLYPWNDKFYFTSSVYNTTTRTNNYELWQTDGTTTGTKLMKKLGINKPEGTWGWMSDDQNLYIRTVQDDGNWETPDTYQLWKTNGTATGTRLVKNLGKWQYYVSQSGGEFDYFNRTKNADYWNSKLYFTSAVYNSTTKTNNYDLWQTDGTVTGTKLVKNFGEYQPNLKGPDDGTNRYFTAVKDDGNSQTNDPRQLWKTDGTTTGTKLVQNLGRVDQYSLGKYLNDHYFYEANTRTYGNELWKLPFTSPAITTRTAIEPNRESNYDPLLEGGLAEKIISLADQSDVILPPELQPNHLHNLLRMTINNANSGDFNQMALDELRTKLSQVQELLPLNMQDSIF